MSVTGAGFGLKISIGIILGLKLGLIRIRVRFRAQPLVKEANRSLMCVRVSAWFGVSIRFGVMFRGRAKASSG